MTYPLSLRVTTLLVALIIPLVSGQTGLQSSSIRVSTPEQIKEDLGTVPCQDKERLPAVKSLFEQANVSASDLTLDKYKNVENLVVFKRGESQEKIIVGAHYDKVADGCGAVDNWTGILTLLHLYKTLKDTPLKKTLLFVAFGKEEKGLLGSRAMANVITKDQASQYCVMINIDSLGLGAPQVADNMSSKKLGKFTAELAKEMKIPFGQASITGADSDSSSFKAKKIPAITIHGLNNEWSKILHSRNDQASKVNPASVYLGYRLTLAMIMRLDQSLCDAYK